MSLNLLHTRKFYKLPMLVLSLCFLFCSFGYARTVKIVSDDADSRLELRNITLPDGTESQLYIIKGETILVTIDEGLPNSTEIIASHIEYDQEASLLRIIGEGLFKTQEEEIEGQDFTISLEDDTFDAFEVEIVTGKVVVRGADATRFPGQLDVSTGSFSLCGRCNQEIEDYGFAAEQMRLYPKDRLVAYDVTVLIKDNPIFFLPLLILPLGPEDKQPRFDLQSGSATSRAISSLHWPYVFAESSFGRLGIRYYADVLAGEGDLFSEQFLGGAVDTSYFGIDLFHRFYTDRGKANLNFSYVPSFVQYSGGNPATGEPIDNTRDQINISLDYSEIGTSTTFETGLGNQQPTNSSSQTEELFFGVSRPQVNFTIRRNDTSRQRIGEYELSLKNQIFDYNADFFSQGFYDFDAEDDVKRPSYSNNFGQGGNPNVTFGKLNLTPINSTVNNNFEFGNLNLSGLLAEIGFFEDDSNSTNRSASQQEVVQALRLLLNQDLNLNMTVPVIGTQIGLTNSFKGQYYSTQNPDGDFERLILWNTQMTLTQALDKYLSFNGGLNRIYRQGETPFSFDGNSLQERTDANFGVNITPFDWLGFNFSQSYVLYDSRDADSIGWGNLTSGMRLFDSNSWFNMNLSNTYDFKNEDPGFLSADLHFRFPAPFWYFPPPVETPDEIASPENGDIDGENTVDSINESDTVEGKEESQEQTSDELLNLDASEQTVQINNDTSETTDTTKEDLERVAPDSSVDSEPDNSVLDTESVDDVGDIQVTDTHQEQNSEEVTKSDVTSDVSEEINQEVGEETSQQMTLDVHSSDVVNEPVDTTTREDVDTSSDDDTDGQEIASRTSELDDGQQVEISDAETQALEEPINESEVENDAITNIDNLALERLQADKNNLALPDALVRDSEDGLNNSEQQNPTNPENIAQEAEVVLPVRPNYNIALDIDHQQDLKVEAEQRDESKTSFSLSGNYESYLSFNARTAYNYVPPTTTEPYPYWDKLTSSLTVGTQDTFDTIPNLTVGHTHDLNTGKGETLTLTGGTTFAPVEFSVSQTFNLLCQEKSVEAKDSCDVSTASFTVLWRDVLRLEASGFALLPVGLFLLDPELDTQEYRLALTKVQAFQDESANWSVTYKSIYDPFLNALSGDTGGWKDSSLSATYQLMDSVYGTPLGDVRLASDISTELLFADDRLLETYVRNLRLNLRGDIFGQLGVAGSLGYDASAVFVPASDTEEQFQNYSRNTLSISNLSFTTKVLPDVYVAAIFNDTWDFRDAENIVQTPWNFQPEIHVIWDRCCWALSGSWDTSDGTVSISLGLNDIAQGLSQEFESPFVLPGRSAN